jgi:SPP1 gp7 family putative phage head morphogenesis protein
MFNISKLFTKKLTATATESEKKRFSKKISTIQIPKAEMDLERLALAVEIAENDLQPDWRPLLAIYKQTMKDAHLRSQIRTAHHTIQQSTFDIYNQNNKPDPARKKLFERSWFTDFIDFAIESEFFGTSLIELAIKDTEGFTECTLIPRYHIIPNTGEVVFDYATDIKFNYRSQLTQLDLIEVGNKDDLGLLETATREVIWKQYSRSDWSQHSEKFGMPLLSIETETVDNTELDNMEDAARNFGANGYMIVNKGDTVSIIQSGAASGNAHLIYKDKAEFCNAEISKLINGQTMTSDNGSSYSQGQVHERILNNYTIARLQRIQRVVNDKLIPHLIRHGYPLQGCKLQYTDLMERQNTPTEPSQPPQTGKAEKKNLTHKGIERCYKLSSTAQHFRLADGFTPLAKSMFDKTMQRLHSLATNNKLPKDAAVLLEAQDMVKAFYSQFNKATQQGFKLEGYTPDPLFINNIKDNLWLFAQLRTYAQLREASNMLFDPEGDLLPWNKFRDRVLDVHQKYNVRYLQAEHSHIIASAQAAAKWQRLQADKDITYLQYRTAGDEAVRSSHAALNGITLPVDHPFWDQYFIPNGWGCRCNVVPVLKTKYTPTDTDLAMQRGQESSTVKNADGTINQKATDSNRIFQFNPGKQAALFPDKHPYMQLKQDIERLHQLGDYHNYKRQLSVEDVSIKGQSYDQVLAQIEHQISNKGNELAFVINKDGKVIYKKTGTSDRVKIEEPQMGFFKDKILTHNHPNEMHFSYGDLVSASKFNFSEIRAVGNEYVFTMKRPTAGWPSTNEISDKVFEDLEWAEEYINGADIFANYEEYSYFREYQVTINTIEYFNLKMTKKTVK